MDIIDIILLTIGTAWVITGCYCVYNAPVKLNPWHDVEENMLIRFLIEPPIMAFVWTVIGLTSLCSFIVSKTKRNHHG